MGKMQMYRSADVTGGSAWLLSVDVICRCDG